MNLIAAVIGWCVIAAVLAVPVGKLINRGMSRQRDDGLPPLPSQMTPHVPPRQPWRPSATDLNDPREDPRNTPPA